MIKLINNNKVIGEFNNKEEIIAHFEAYYFWDAIDNDQTIAEMSLNKWLKLTNHKIINI